MNEIAMNNPKKSKGDSMLESDPCQNSEIDLIIETDRITAPEFLKEEGDMEKEYIKPQIKSTEHDSNPFQMAKSNGNNYRPFMVRHKRIPTSGSICPIPQIKPKRHNSSPNIALNRNIKEGLKQDRFPILRINIDRHFNRLPRANSLFNMLDRNSGGMRSKYSTNSIGLARTSRCKYSPRIRQTFGFGQSVRTSAANTPKHRLRKWTGTELSPTEISSGGRKQSADSPALYVDKSNKNSKQHDWKGSCINGSMMINFDGTLETPTMKNQSFYFGTQSEECFEESSFLSGNTFLPNTFWIPTARMSTHVEPLYFKLEDNCKDMFNNPRELGLYMENIFGSASSLSEITLPPMEMEMEDLVLGNSMQIKGSAGTILNIFGSIVIMSGACVEFFECEIQLNLSGPRCIEEALVLFNIENQANLRLTDCQLNSRVNKEFLVETQKNLAPNKVLSAEHDNRFHQILQDACFFLQSSTSPNDCSMIELTSCRVNNFFSGLVLGNNSKTGLYQCGITKCRNSCILAVNPSFLEVKDSVLENSKENGIEVRFSRMGEMDINECDKRFHIDIVNNTIKDMAKTGIAILGEAEETQNIRLMLKIDSNIIGGNKGEGVYVKDLNLNSCEISNNQISGNHSTGIDLNNIKVEGGQVACEWNKCNESKTGCGISAIDTLVKFKNNQTWNNNSHGVNLRNKRLENFGSTQISDVHTLIENHISKGNGQGVCIVDINYIVHISQSTVTENKHYGLYLGTKHLDRNIKKRGNGEGKYILCRVEVIDSEIRKNKQGGIYLDQNFLHISHTRIMQNGPLAIHIPNTQITKIITFNKEYLKKANSLIEGKVGGIWGDIKISNEKPSPDWTNIKHEKKKVNTRSWGCCCRSKRKNRQGDK